MAMGEDFGDFGDEQFLGFCAEDWRDYAPLDAGENLRRAQERRSQHERDELALEFLEENGVERDLSDIVREHEESEYFSEDSDYLNCDWEE